MATKRPDRDRLPWSDYDMKYLRSAATKRYAHEIAGALRRTLPAVMQKAMRSGISFRAAA